MGYAEVATEMNIIFEYIEEDLVNKIPNRFREFLDSIASTTYVAHIDPRFPLYDQPLLPDTEILLVVLYNEYWATPEEREEINSMIIENDEKLKGKYCVDAIFDKVEEIKSSQSEALPTILDESPWYIKLKNLCKKILDWLLKD